MYPPFQNTFFEQFQEALIPKENGKAILHAVGVFVWLPNKNYIDSIRKNKISFKENPLWELLIQADIIDYHFFDFIKDSIRNRRVLISAENYNTKFNN